MKGLISKLSVVLAVVVLFANVNLLAKDNKVELSTNITCQGCVNTIKTAFKGMDGVKDVSANIEQKSFDLKDRLNTLQVVVAPDNENAVWINQDAWFSQIHIQDNSFMYNLNRTGNGVYVFVISGSVEIDGETLNKRDGIEINETESFELSSKDAEVLFIEIPMK